MLSSASGSFRESCIVRRRTNSRRAKTLAVSDLIVCLRTKPVGEPDAGNPHVRFDERGWETERCRMAQVTAPILDSTFSGISLMRGMSAAGGSEHKSEKGGFSC
jgi:hypothetical protein